MIGHLLLSLVLAGVAIAILVRGLRFRPATPVWSLFLILFFAIWAGGLWAGSTGRLDLGVAWLPFTLIAVLVTVLLMAVSPKRDRSHRQEMEVERKVEEAVGLYFWILIGGLVVAIVVGYR